MERALNGVEVPHYHRGEVVGTSRRFDERLTLGLLAMRDSLRPPRRQSWHPAAAYGAGEFTALLDRVGHGAMVWDEGPEGGGDEVQSAEAMADEDPMPEDDSE